MKQCALCNRPALDDPQAQGFCILHAPWDGKDLSAFQAAIEEIIQKAQQGSGVCDFSYCYFPTNYDCQNLRKAFKFSCIFQGSKFVGEVNFFEAEFAGDADFEGAEFARVADFRRVSFAREANFWGAKFFKDVDFWRASFSVATFREAEFAGNAYFMETNSGIANFMKARFIGNAYFEKAELDDDFEKSEFFRDAVFLEAKFSREANFSETEFCGVTLFARAKFPGSANFSGAKFSGNANFEEAEFSQEASFDGTTFLQYADFSYVKTSQDVKVWFWNVNFSKPQQIKFHHVDLSRWSFLDTDLRRIDFDDVTWGSIRRLWSRRTAIFDEIRVSNKEVEKEYLAKVERLYRHLKQNYESQRDYGRAGDFYYGEMEMKRPQLRWWGQIPFLLYRFMSGYGESYGRALIVLLGMCVFFAVLFTFAGYTDKDMGISVQRYWTWNPSEWWGTISDIASSLIYSAQSMTLFHEPNITFHSQWGMWANLFASILGVIQIALFGLALQRRFKR